MISSLCEMFDLIVSNEAPELKLIGVAYNPWESNWLTGEVRVQFFWIARCEFLAGRFRDLGRQFKPVMV